MNDITTTATHRTRHTVGNCRGCRPSRSSLAGSANRLRHRIDDIIGQRELCLHQRTRTYIEPDTIEGEHGRVLEGATYTVCRDCLKPVRPAS